MPLFDARSFREQGCHDDKRHGVPVGFGEKEELARSRIAVVTAVAFVAKRVRLADEFGKHGEFISHELRRVLPLTVIGLEPLLDADRVVRVTLLALVLED